MASDATDEQPVSASSTASHPYTCNTCQVAYRSIELQKSHMKSDWHRYNLKRRVASLPPISADTFTEKVLQARAVTNAEADKAYFERVCEACNKTYYSANAYQNHLSSAKHKHNEHAAGQPRDDETRSVISSTFSLGEPAGEPEETVDVDVRNEFSQVVQGFNQNGSSQQRPSPVKRPSNPQAAQHGEFDDTTERNSNSSTPVRTQGDAWTLQSCVFCNYQSPTAPLNVQHMERFHGMFIPEKTYLVNLDGLIEKLQKRVHEDNECLFCGKVKANAFAVQTHMRDTGHCKIPFETEEEQLDVGEFYDFRGTYSDEEEESEDDSEVEEAQGAKLGARRAAKPVDSDDEADGWETDSSESSLDSADLTAVPAEGHLHQFERLDKHRHHSHHDPRQRHQADGWHSHAHKHTHAVFHDDYELHLPSGKSVGHRSLNKYYRQNLTNYPTPEERAERLAIEGPEQQSESAALTRAKERSRQVVPRGTAGIVGITDGQKRDLKKAEQRGRHLETVNTKKTDYAYSKKLNNQKNFYYRYDGGG